MQFPRRVESSGDKSQALQVSQIRVRPANRADSDFARKGGNFQPSFIFQYFQCALFCFIVRSVFPFHFLRILKFITFTLFAVNPICPHTQNSGVGKGLASSSRCFVRRTSQRIQLPSTGISIVGADAVLTTAPMFVIPFTMATNAHRPVDYFEFFGFRFRQQILGGTNADSHGDPRHRARQESNPPSLICRTIRFRPAPILNRR
jgi:hypothetical protein